LEAAVLEVVPGPRRLALAALAGAALALAGCGGGDDTTAGGGTSTGAAQVELVSDGKLTTCTHLPYEPFQFEREGEIVGFDVQLVDLVAKDLGVEQAIVDTPFETIQSGEDLNAGKCDLAAAGMTITDVRKQNLDFSDPYFEATQALITKKGSGIASLDALQGKKLAVQSGTTGEEYATKNAKGAELVQFEDLGLLLAAVKTGQVDAGINDNGVVYDFAKKNPDTEVTTEFDTGEQYGIGVRKGNTALLEKINAVLAKSRQDGSYDKIYQTWFGTNPKG
jgi:polar amino acid transport system substrate-binding protein